MENTEQIKDAVRQKYSEIALQDKETNQASCCGAGGLLNRGLQHHERRLHRIKRLQ